MSAPPIVVPASREVGDSGPPAASQWIIVGAGVLLAVLYFTMGPTKEKRR